MKGSEGMMQSCAAWMLAFTALFGSSQASEVVATVNGEPIYRSEVASQIKRALQGRHVADDVRQKLESETLQQLINQQLVLKYLVRKGIAASDQDVDLAISRLKQNLGRQEKTLEDYFEFTGMDEELLRRYFRWQISWQAFLDGYLTDENLQRYFKQHQREFDGSELRVAQILWKADGPDEIKAALVKAEAVRRQLEQGELTFADAAVKYSQAPSAADGGVQGWIKRQEPMPEAFTVAAFQLKVGQVSPPVTTSFGVHIIKCLEEKPGQRQWEQARDELRKAVTRFLFVWAANREREEAEIELK
jgi:parvulin-like peptidyl-prolyl isomerase